MTLLRRLLQPRLQSSSNIRYVARRSITSRTMATTNGNSSTPNATTEPTASSDSQEQTSEQPLPLPEPTGEIPKAELDIASGLGVKLDQFGPMVVNRDGTLSRISNWDQMADVERQNTLRILGKRNKLRMATLKDDEDGKTGN
jgi:hypothetical protein